MNEVVSDLYSLPNIDKYQDLNLLALSENCAVLESRVYALAKSLPYKERQIIEAYITTRDDLEIEAIKAALRWGKRHCK